MSNINLFFKKNKPTKENAFYPATKSLLDKDGKPLMWEIKPITTRENEIIQEKCIKEVPMGVKSKLYRSKVDHCQYMCQTLVTSVVYPDLLNTELQDSYGVKKPEDLLREMIDNVSEYNAFFQFVQEFNEFDNDLDLEEGIEIAKN